MTSSFSSTTAAARGAELFAEPLDDPDEPYRGVFSGYRPLDEALADLDSATEEALRRMNLRLGIVPAVIAPFVVAKITSSRSWARSGVAP